ncbi:MAG TPA: metallophosphoesterase [Firmicutes bacterium]|nr:metallophosphoesterase [Bacillota bacterium]
MRKWLMRSVLLVVLALAAQVAVDTCAIKVEVTEVNLAGLPEALDGYRILQISDFHGRRFARDGSVAKKILAAKPDIIVLTGDYVNRETADIYNLYPLLEVMTSVAPVYAVSGNHDHWTNWRMIAGALRVAGVEVLENRHVMLRKNGRTLVLAGVNDPYSGHADLASALPQTATGPVILLAHAPTWFESSSLYGSVPALAENRALLEKVALTLTGHTHGGQIKIPFIGPLTTASGRLFPKTHIEGLLREQNGWLYISRGIGQTGILPVRFLSRAEISLIILRSAQ